MADMSAVNEEFKNKLKAQREKRHQLENELKPSDSQSESNRRLPTVDPPNGPEYFQSKAPLNLKAPHSMNRSKMSMSGESRALSSVPVVRVRHGDQGVLI